MSHLVDLVKLSQIDKLIRQRLTGNPDEFAKRLNIPLGTLLRYIAYLKEELDAPVLYDNEMLSFIYSYAPNFHLEFEPSN